MPFLEKVAVAVTEEALDRLSRPDPASFGDPLALDIPWTKAPAVSSNFRNFKLVSDGPGRLRYLPTTMQRLYASMFLLVGTALTLLFGWLFGVYGLFGLVPVGLGLYLLMPTKMEFDGNTRRCTLSKLTVPFDAVRALQLLEHLETDSEDPSFYSYQLNLVLSDKTRVTVVDHGKLDEIRSEAQQLATLLGCKVWDGPAARKK